MGMIPDLETEFSGELGEVGKDVDHGENFLSSYCRLWILVSVVWIGF